MSSQDDADLYEMVGTLIEWDGRMGLMISDDGDRVRISNLRMLMRKQSFPLAVGCRVYCLVSAEVSYSVKEIRFVVPEKADPERMVHLKRLARTTRSREIGQVLADFEFPESFTGTLESLDRRKNKAVIRRADGVEVIVSDTRKWIKKHQRVTPGMSVRFEAVCLAGQWVVHRTLSFADEK